MIFDNPVRGPVIAFGKPRPPDKPRAFRVTQSFGCTSVAAEPKGYGCAHFHRGMDIGNGRCNDDVLAMAKGAVRFAGDPGNGDLVVMIWHGNGWATSYWHLNGKAGLNKGDRVSAGQKIGIVGDRGISSECHCHVVVKSGLPSNAGIATMYPEAYGGTGDSVGRWRDPWPLLKQNVTVHPTTEITGVNIRNGPSTTVAAHAATRADGLIHRISDGTGLGPTRLPRDWGGTVTGGEYQFKGTTRKDWEKMLLDGAWRYVAAAYAIRSAY